MVGTIEEIRIWAVSVKFPEAGNHSQVRKCPCVQEIHTGIFKDREISYLQSTLKWFRKIKKCVCKYTKRKTERIRKSKWKEYQKLVNLVKRLGIQDFSVPFYVTFMKIGKSEFKTKILMLLLEPDNFSQNQSNARDGREFRVYFA